MNEVAEFELPTQENFRTDLRSRIALMDERRLRSSYVAFMQLPEDARNDLAMVGPVLERAGLTCSEVSRATRGRFHQFAGVRVVSDAGKAFFPLCPASAICPSGVRGRGWRTTILRAGWITPSYLQNQFVAQIVQELEAAPEERRSDVLEAALARVYTPLWIASMVTERYRRLPPIAHYLPVIREAIDAFYLGLCSAAISALLPVVEGAARRILPLRNTLVGKNLIREFIQRAIQRYVETLVFPNEWVPPEYRSRSFLVRVDEYVMMLDGFCEYGVSSLYESVNRQSGDLNRHGISHGISDGFGRPGNFYRLMSLLDFLTFVATMNSSGVSILAPDGNAESMKLAHRFVALKGLATELARIPRQELT